MWYAASLLYKNVRAPTESEPTIWEESIRLILARSEAEAFAEAQQLGQSEARSYEIEDGSVTWTFEHVERIFVIDDEDLRSGSEVFSRFLRDSEVKSLLTPFD